MSLHTKLQQRIEEQNFRRLGSGLGLVDFCSNDYLGLASTLKYRIGTNLNTGSGGSRLLAGNYPQIEALERSIAKFHDAQCGLIFNSGYDANIGLLSAIGLKGDTIIYDQLIHASLRDGIRLGYAQSFSFEHNNVLSLEQRLRQSAGTVYVVVESLYSMDGDLAPLADISDLCKQYNAQLIVDEAHATGIIGEQGEGLVQQLNLQSNCFARIHTFGKALGVHGAIVLGSDFLRSYLINFSRAFIYTTALPPSTVGHIEEAYKSFPGMKAQRNQIRELVAYFRAGNLKFPKVDSGTAIQGIIISGNLQVVQAAEALALAGLDVRPIRYPTVPAGSERLRVILHSFNTVGEVERIFQVLNGYAS